MDDLAELRRVLMETQERLQETEKERDVLEQALLEQATSLDPKMEWRKFTRPGEPDEWLLGLTKDATVKLEPQDDQPLPQLEDVREQLRAAYSRLRRMQEQLSSTEKERDSLQELVEKISPMSDDNLEWHRYTDQKDSSQWMIVFQKNRGIQATEEIVDDETFPGVLGVILDSVTQARLCEAEMRLKQTQEQMESIVQERDALRAFVTGPGQASLLDGHLHWHTYRNAGDGSEWLLGLVDGSEVKQEPADVQWVVGNTPLGHAP